mgnify:CR=1 FL=1
MRQRPLEQDKIQRRSNFDAVESNLTVEQVKLEASRCLNCKNPQYLSFSINAKANGVGLALNF